MGMVTVIVINNDYLNAIRDDANFGAKVWDSAIAYYGGDASSRRLGERGYGYVVSVDHADHEQYLLIHRQNTRPLTYEEIQDIEAGRRRRERKAEKIAKKHALDNT